ncbi:MAG: response regulator, partial [Actinomycetota bacterium]|nr:response regulator [Actinomycetota bacterium]
MTAADVFVVDDNPNNLDLLVGILREHGYGARMASDGRRALAVVRAHRPELILLDIKMADMDGYEVCRELKADPTTREIPVIFISALDDVFDKVKAFKTGGVDYITKPFQAEEVVARVENQLQISRLRRKLEARERDLEQRNAELLAKNEELLRSRELKAAREEYSRRFIELQEHDRKRIASELHDSISQSIVIIKNRALHGLEDRDDAENALEQLEEISEAATHALDEVRRIAYDLRPFQIDRLGLTAAIDALVG